MVATCLAGGAREFFARERQAAHVWHIISFRTMPGHAVMHCRDACHVAPFICFMLSHAIMHCRYVCHVILFRSMPCHAPSCIFVMCLSPLSPSRSCSPPHLTFLLRLRAVAQSRRPVYLPLWKHILCSSHMQHPLVSPSRPMGSIQQPMTAVQSLQPTLQSPRPTLPHWFLPSVPSRPSYMPVAHLDS